MSSEAVKAKYIRGSLLGSGTWGEVFESTRLTDQRRVAIKRFKAIDSHLGINTPTLREIKFLRELKHENIVELVDVFMSASVIHMVLEFCPTDLARVIQDQSVAIGPAQAKAFMQMIIAGVLHMHENFVLHRDIKPENMLIGFDGRIKIADFGFAKGHSSPDRLTRDVNTLWYKPPELLFGAKSYSVGVDNWAVGCTFAYMLFRTPLFAGTTEIEQLKIIFNVLGTPKLSQWPDVNLLPNYMEFEEREPVDLRNLFGKPKEGQTVNGLPSSLHFLLELLVLNPQRRMTMDKALQHPYFAQEPKPCELHELPLPQVILSELKNAQLHEMMEQEKKRQRLA